jgi:citrate lyase subunit beta/citryl-CoA lyase
LTWGAEDLSVALNATTNVDERGEWLPPYELARGLCLLAAAGAGVPAIDTVYTDFRDPGGLERQARAARRDGFAGKLAIHPDQVEIINEAFRPSAEEIALARRVLAAFGATPAGVVALDGRMLDRPHELRARRTLHVADAIEKRTRGSAGA